MHNSDIKTIKEEVIEINSTEKEKQEIEEFNLNYALNDDLYCYFNSVRLHRYLSAFNHCDHINEKILRRGFPKHYSVEIYLKNFLDTFTYFNYKLNHDNFNYFLIKEKRKQSFVSILNVDKVSQLTYSTGLVLCALGFKKNNMYKTLKKQRKGFIKCFNHAKNLIIPKLLKKLNKKESQLGIIITGRGKFTKNYAEIPEYLESINAKTLFMLWIPKVRFSFVKLRKYGRIKRNLRKRIVKTLMLSEKLKKKEIKKVKN